MVRLPTSSTRTDTHFPYTALFRSRTNRLTQDIAGRILFRPGRQFDDIRDHAERQYSGSLDTRIDHPSWSERSFCRGGQSTYPRSEEHTSELKSPMRSSYAVFCSKKKRKKPTRTQRTHHLQEY